MLNLCIDIDGTITEPYYWLPLANYYFKTNIKPEHVTDYNINKILGIQEKDYKKFYKMYGRLIHKESDIRPGAKEVINKLYFDHNIHFVTARENKMKAVTYEWLSKHNIPMDSLSLLGSHNKTAKAKELKADLFIEDCYDNALQLSEAGFDVLLINCNYNQGTLPFNVYRVDDWYQIENIVNFYSYKKITADVYA